MYGRTSARSGAYALWGCDERLLANVENAFPDATVVLTHRDPVSIVQSAATMLTYAARLSYRTVDPHFYIRYWTDRIEQLLAELKSKRGA